jgi:hypothetical protein
MILENLVMMLILTKVLGDNHFRRPSDANSRLQGNKGKPNPFDLRMMMLLQVHLLGRQNLSLTLSKDDEYLISPPGESL